MRRKHVAPILGLLLACAVSTSAQATFPGGNGRIVYLRFTSRSITPRTIDPDGTGDMSLSDAPSGGYSFTASPDGTELAFTKGGGHSLAILDLGTGTVTKVITAPTLHAERITWSAFSPDASKLAVCTQHRRKPHERLFVVNADGSSPMRISGDISMCAPDWSTTDRIAASHDGDRTTIYTMDPDGGNLIKTVTSRSRPSRYTVGARPSWAPDGSKLVFVSAAGARRTDVWRMRADGTHLSKLIHTKDRWDWMALYSPDGTSIAVSTAGHNAFSPEDIWIYNADGTGSDRITHTKVDEYLQTWIPT